MAMLVSTDLHSELSANDLSCVATVCENSRATDHAVALSPTRLAVIRCVEHGTPADHSALATMLAEGDFVWAGLVYSKREGSEPIGLIETFHIDELEQLVARLRELGGPPDEAS